MKYIALALSTLFLCSGFSFPGTSAAPAPEPRSANTCADPSLAVPFVQAFNVKQNAYALASVASFTAGVTGGPTSGWVYQGETFLAWVNPDNFTTPLYHAFNPTSTDFIAIMSSDGSVPSVPGFNAAAVMGYAYTSPMCESVPLLAASNQAAGSHYYTTDSNVHAQLISISGWKNAGIAAYVLPLPFVW